MIRFAIGCAIVASLGVPLRAASAVATTDGLVVSVDDSGRVASITVDKKSVTLADDPVLFRIRDVDRQTALVPITAAVQSIEKGFSLKTAAPVSDLDLAATFMSHGRFIQIDGTITDRRKSSRCIDLKLSLPIAGGSFKYGTGLSAEAPRKKLDAKRQSAEAIDELYPVDDSSVYPLSPASDVAFDVGLSLAVPPTSPTRFLTGLDDTGLNILIRIGLSSAARPQSQTPFHVILFRHDPAWGFRSSLERYYEFYREPFFTRRVKKTGLWTTHNVSQLFEKELYAYHEAGSTAWGRPEDHAGKKEIKSLENLAEGPLAHSLDEFEQLCELDQDAAAGIASLPYSIVGQCQFLQLAKLPKNYAEAMHILDTWNPTKPIPFNGPAQAVSFRSADELKAIIRNSTIENPEHRLELVARPYRGPTLTFVENPNPRLFNDSNKQTIAKYMLDDYLPMLLASKYVEGLYTDSLGRWCSYFNYRTDHFKYSTVPLTYAGSPPKPCISNLASHAEYLWELSSRLHKLGKIVFANGVHPDRVMLGFDADAMGCEGTPVYTLGENFYAPRVAAGSKPYCYLNESGKSTPRLWNSCLYLGYLLTCNTRAGAPLMRQYDPTIIKMNQAGWEPVTYAQASPESIGIERWGKFPALFFSAMNRSTIPVTAQIRIDARRLALPAKTAIINALTGETISHHADNSTLILQLQLKAEQAGVMELRAQ